MSNVAEAPLVEQARAALDRHSWREAHDLFLQADAERTLGPDDLELLAESAWWVGQLPQAIDARERSYAAYLKVDDRAHAALIASFIARDNILRVDRAVAEAWIHRAERLVDGMPENPVHGWIAALHAFAASRTGDFDEARRQAARMREIGTRFGDRDLEASGMSYEGLSLVAQGKVDEGLALIDDATLAAFGGELRPEVAGSVSCTTISACASLGDWSRAVAWTEAQDRWCKRENIAGFPGMCRLHRAEIKALRGDWLDAEAEARQASNELQGFVPAAVGVALYEIGLIRLRRGDFPAAEEALLRAHAVGYEPQPALSLLRLAQGRAAEATATITRALDEPERSSPWGTAPGTELSRLALLPARVEIALATGDVPLARAAADELKHLATRFANTASAASASAADGAVLLAERQLPAAEAALRAAIAGWAELNAPYEAARTRLVLAETYLAQDAPAAAAMELQAARAAFETLGAMVDRQAAERALASLEAPGDGPQLGMGGARLVMTFVFTDIVDSTRLAGQLGPESWERVIEWHDRTVRAVVAEHGGQEVKAIGDGFFLAFGQPDAAIECAIDLQRRLSAGRIDPEREGVEVRIGIHQAEARRAGMDYLGIGVNEAARIGAAARGGEVLASASTLAAARRTFPQGDRRTLELKGLADPVEAVVVPWTANGNGTT